MILLIMNIFVSLWKCRSDGNIINEKLLLEKLLKRDSVKDEPASHIFTPLQFSVINIHIRTKDKKALNSDRKTTE